MIAKIESYHYAYSALVNTQCPHCKVDVPAQEAHVCHVYKEHLDPKPQPETEQERRHANDGVMCECGHSLADHIGGDCGNIECHGDCPCADFCFDTTRFLCERIAP